MLRLIKLMWFWCTHLLFKIFRSAFYCSTLQNIIFRYGLDRQLNFVLPNSGNHLNDPRHPYIILEPFKIDWLDSQEDLLPWHSQLKQNQAYDIFNLHTQWNASAVRWVVLEIFYGFLRGLCIYCYIFPSFFIKLYKQLSKVHIMCYFHN